ncbi:MAG TPA: beta-N-acetylglucosaminidase domain-containing protein [Caulobacteraceae bacterium]
MMVPELGVIEGYYGAPWPWAAREETVRVLAPHGYRFFLYAPKADPFLRRRWQEDHPPQTAEALRRLAKVCASQGVRFGVGLSPFEIYRDFGAAAKDALARKLAALDDLGVEHLAILFDDMRGDLDGLADTQAAIMHWIAERTGAARIVVCPTYYSDDPGLDRAFGARPDGYLERFGAALDPAIDIFWTGEEVCSREYSPGHLERVARQLRRKPMLWDNYPVNDGPIMGQSLHLRAFTGRPAAIGAHLSGHAVNPALQPVLSRIPAITLAESYAMAGEYQYGAAFERAAIEVLGPDLARTVRRHLSLLQNTGLDRLGDAAARLRQRYAAVDHDGAREIVAWLDGAYQIDPAEME